VCIGKIPVENAELKKLTCLDLRPRVVNFFNLAISTGISPVQSQVKTAKKQGWFTGRTIQLTDQFYFHCAGSKKSEAEGKEKFFFDFDFSALIRRFSLGAYS
jgi:hypothetical protein